MTRTLSKASGLFEFIDFCLSSWQIYMNSLAAVTIYFVLSNVSNKLHVHVAFLLPVSILYLGVITLGFYLGFYFQVIKLLDDAIISKLIMICLFFQ